MPWSHSNSGLWASSSSGPLPASRDSPCYNNLLFLQHNIINHKHQHFGPPMRWPYNFVSKIVVHFVSTRRSIYQSGMNINTAVREKLQWHPSLFFACSRPSQGFVNREINFPVSFPLHCGRYAGTYLMYYLVGWFKAARDLKNSKVCLPTSSHMAGCKIRVTS